MAACHGKGSSTTVVKYFLVLSFLWESKMRVFVTRVLRVGVYVFVFVCLCFCVSLSQCVCLCVRVSVCGCVYVCVCVYIVQVCSGALPSRKCVCALLQVQGSWSTTGGWRGEKG